MNGFSTTNAFRLVRRLATIGPENPSLYLLIAAPPAMQAIHADIAAEVQVQLGVGLRALAPADLRFDGSEDAFAQDPDRPVALITLDHWMPQLVTALDRNVVLLTKGGAVLLLANAKIAERMLAEAPNLRNRLTDIFAIVLDEALEGPVA
jgi:hypothetical protein